MPMYPICFIYVPGVYFILEYIANNTQHITPYTEQHITPHTEEQHITPHTAAVTNTVPTKPSRIQNISSHLPLLKISVRIKLLHSLTKLVNIILTNWGCLCVLYFIRNIQTVVTLSCKF